MFLDLFAPFVVGLVGSLHCLGMCGPLILAYSLHLQHPQERLSTDSSKVHIGTAHHLLFHAGRLLTYGFLGALAASLFYVANLALFFKEFRGGFTMLGGVLMILFGLVILKVVRLPAFATWVDDAKGVAGIGWFASFFHGQVGWKPRRVGGEESRPSNHIYISRKPRPVGEELHSKRLVSKVALGLATGFLPCGLSWAMIAKAAATQQVPLGFLTMIAFGLGTVPILLMTGVSASFFSLRMRLLGERLSGVAVILMGLILAYKGGRIFV